MVPRVSTAGTFAILNWTKLAGSGGFGYLIANIIRIGEFWLFLSAVPAFDWLKTPAQFLPP